MNRNSKHPAIRRGGDLTRGERAADSMRNGLGSWTFVFSALTFLGFWMWANRDSTFDPFPYILLNLILSMIAALQGAILLIAAKREDQISTELAEHTFKIDQENLELTREVHLLTKRIEALTVEVHEMVKNRK